MYYQRPTHYSDALRHGRFQAYLDVIEDRLEQGMFDEAKTLYGQTLRKILMLPRTELDTQEYRAIEKLVFKYPRIFGNSLSGMFARAKTFGSLPRPSQTKEKFRFLVLEEMLPQAKLQAIQEEVRRNEVLWSLDTDRQKTIRHHSQTNSITLFAPLDNPFVSNAVTREYSRKESIAKLFPALVSYIEDFARNKNGCLARVALVRLKPDSVVFRHSDGDAVLKGFDRYHVVIESKGGSLMNIGDEERIFPEGSTFFFENKVVHSAYNFSDRWRTHLILDMRVPKGQEKSTSIHSYRDWAYFDPSNAEALADYKIPDLTDTIQSNEHTTVQRKT